MDLGVFPLLHTLPVPVALPFLVFIVDYLLIYTNFTFSKPAKIFYIFYDIFFDTLEALYFKLLEGSILVFSISEEDEEDDYDNYEDFTEVLFEIYNPKFMLFVS